MQKRVLFVGASDINTKIFSYLMNKGVEDITVCNRSFEAAEKMASNKAQILKIEYIDSWPIYDWVIVGTTAADFLLSKERAVIQNKNAKLIVDLSVPRNVDPKIEQISGVTLLNIDQINRTLKIRSRHIKDELLHAEDFCERSALRQAKIFEEKTIKQNLILTIAG